MHVCLPERELFRKSILKDRMISGHWAPNFFKQKPTFKYKIDCRAPQSQRENRGWLLELIRFPGNA